MSLRWPHLLLIFLAALTLRGAFVLTRPIEIVYPDANEKDQLAPNLLATGQYPDAKEYDHLARNLLLTGQYQEKEGRVASRAPGYPLFLAGLYKAGLDSPRAVGLVQALLDALMCVVMALLGKRVFGDAVGAVAGWMAALYPFFIYFTWLLLAETAFTLCLVALFLLLIRMVEATDTHAVSCKSSIINHQLSMTNLALPAGLLCGALTLLRSSFFLMPLFLLPFLLVRPVGRLRRAAAWGVMVAVMALALMPWTIRNYRIFHHVIPTTLQVGESLYEACSPYADGGPAMNRIDWDKERGGAMGEYENNEFFKNAALKYIRENPGRCLKLAAVKFVRFWNILPNYSEFRSPLYAIISILASVPVLLLALVGLWRCRDSIQGACAAAHGPCEGSNKPSQGSTKLLLLLAPVIYYTLLHMVFVGSVRYRTPIMPFVLLFAAAGAVQLWSRLTSGGRRRNDE